MIAAIYARKSTEQRGADADSKSVARQIESARAFAAAKGWTVDDAHVYSDDAVSGADPKRLVNRQRLLDALRANPPFRVIIMRDASRFSRRDGDEAFGELKAIARAGVDVWFYQDGQRFAFGTLSDNVVGFFKAEMNAEWCRQIAKWTHDAMERKARAGHVTGGRVFGYDNLRVDGHVERRVNDAEAAVVRRIFELCADGRGVRAIAKILNADGAVCPRAQRGRPKSWAPSSVREALYRWLYGGEIVWNQTRKRDSGGAVKQQARTAEQWIRIAAPELRLVSADLWNQAHARLETARGAYLRGTNGRLWGRPTTGLESKYLLPGIAKCAVCGGGLLVTTRRQGQQREAFYGCSSHYYRGDSVCANSLRVSLPRVESAVLEAFERQILHPDVVERALAVALEQLGPATEAMATDEGTLRDALVRLEGEIGRLTEAVAAGGNLPSLLAALTDRHARRTALDQRLRSLEYARRTAQSDLRGPAAALRETIEDWRGLLRRQVPQARQILRKLLQGALLFTPKRDGDECWYEFHGEGSLAKFFASATNTFSVASPPGFEPGSRP